jgi:hypothetical protein
MISSELATQALIDVCKGEYRSTVSATCVREFTPVYTRVKPEFKQDPILKMGSELIKKLPRKKL